MATNNAIGALTPDRSIVRSIETHVEPVLSANLEREQGQSGAHIWRPYTGAEKGKETVLLDVQLRER